MGPTAAGTRDVPGAVPTYRWARRIASTGWALAAAAIVLTAPALHYSGFLMTEPLTLTVVTAALLALARALEEPSMWRYGVFVAWATAASAVRLQAMVLLPAFLLAALVDVARRARPCAATAAALVRRVRGGRQRRRRRRRSCSGGGELSSRRLLGAYTPVGQAGNAAGNRFDEVAWHAFEIAVLGLGVTVLATAVVALRVLADAIATRAPRAFVP